MSRTKRLTFFNNDCLVRNALGLVMFTNNVHDVKEVLEPRNLAYATLEIQKSQHVRCLTKEHYRPNIGLAPEYYTAQAKRKLCISSSLSSTCSVSIPLHWHNGIFLIYRYIATLYNPNSPVCHPYTPLATWLGLLIKSRCGRKVSLRTLLQQISWYK